MLDNEAIDSFETLEYFAFCLLNADLGFTNEV